MKLESELSNYATKADLKNAAGVDTTKFGKNVDFANLKSNVETPIFTNLATTAAINAKINEAKCKIPNITNLATTATALTAVENKKPNVSSLAKNTDYNTKASEIENKITADHDHDKHITPQ